MKKDKLLSQLTYKNILWIITYTILLILALLYIKSIISGVKMIFSLLKPFMIGFALAYMFSIPMRYFQKKIPDKWKNKEMLSAILSFLCVVLVLTFVISVVVPQLRDSIMTLIEEFPSYAKATEETMMHYMSEYNLDEALIEQWNVYSKQIEETVLNVAKSILPMIMGMAGSIISTVTDLVMAIVSAIYFTVTKDTLLTHVKKACYAFLPKSAYEYGGNVVRLSDKTFSNFISGQLMEALIIGVLCYIGAIVLRLEYAPILAVIIGCTNIIPIFGPIIGTIICSVLLLFVSPMQAIIFVIFGILLQQFESNLIYPKVVGSSVGLSGIWVLLAVSVGGGLFGALGMILGLPVVAIVYRLFADEVHRRIKLKEEKVKAEIENEVEL